MINSDSIDLRVAQQRTSDGTRRLLQLDNLGHPKYPDASVFFDMVGEYDVAPPSLLDGFVACILLAAMQLGRDIRVHGRMSLQAMRNLTELQEVWSVWRPGWYNKIRIEPDDVVDHVDTDRPNEAIAAFSGGVDSTFTVLRHTNENLGTASYPLKRTVLIVHGFDVPLAKPSQFQALVDRTSPLLRELNLQPRILRTNVKGLNLVRWGDSFVTQLACCLHNYSHEFNYGLVASTKAYDSIITPDGSTPIADHLLSGAALSIVHDGAGYSRTEKVELIARNPTAAAIIKVCWEGAATHKNCGVCDKCVRTQLNFLAVGVLHPACFDRDAAHNFDPRKRIDSMRVHGDTMCMELRSLLAYARAHGIAGQWVTALDRRVRRYDAEKSERRYGNVRAALGMARRGDWKRLAQRAGHKVWWDLIHGGHQ